MRISDWSSDVCSSDLLFKMERLVRGDAVFIAGAVGDHRPRADRDQYLARRHRSSADQQGVWAGHRSTVEHDLDAVVLKRLGVEAVQPGDFGQHEIGRAHVELQSLMRISYAVFCLKKKNKSPRIEHTK